LLNEFYSYITGVVFSEVANTLDEINYNNRMEDFVLISARLLSLTIISGCWSAACTGILETCITCMLHTSLVHYLQLIIQLCHFFSFSSFLFFLSFFLFTLSFTLHFFLATTKNFWDQWSCGPLYYAALHTTSESEGKVTVRDKKTRKAGHER
jgi:hypothetical protein